MVAIGAGLVLIIGAFARFDTTSIARPAVNPSPTPAALTQDDPPPADAAGGPTLPPSLSPGLSEIIKLAQAHVNEGVILAYIKNSGQAYSPTADEILYLSDIGLSQDVIGALVQTAPPAAKQQPSPALAASPSTSPSPPIATPTEPLTPEASQPEAASAPNIFYNDLTPYGAWVQQPDYGLCWQPTVETIDPNWTPYLDAGQWMYSDCGWYWQSDYTWGWAAFHYGRWTRAPRLGWVWVPGNQWGPAWVAWRSTDSYIGWAPLPPGVSLNVLAQLTYDNHLVGRNATLGLSASAYHFVNTGGLVGHNLPHRVVPPAQAKDLAHNSELLSGYTIVNHRIFNNGISREVVASAAQRPVRQVALHAVSSPETAGLAMDRKTLGVYVPPASSASASVSTQSVMNKPAQREVAASQNADVLAENRPVEEEPVSTEPSSDVTPVQLPSLHYPPSDSPQAVHRHPRGVIIASGSDAAPIHRDWQPRFGTTAMERPVTPAPVPRYDGFNPGVGQGEAARPAMEGRAVQPEIRPAPAEIRPAPVQPARSAPAPSSSSSSSSKSGK